MSHPTPTDPRAFVLGSEVGRWRILELQDFGSFGALYRVERTGQPESGPFALKIALEAGDRRFEREAELLQRGEHASIPSLEDKGEWSGPDGRSYPYVVMEWVQGRQLYEWARVHQPTSREVLRVLAQVASALGQVHGDGGVHRDVKGDNILVTGAGRAVLLDWGGGTYAGAKALTDTLLPPGTAHYRSPEAVHWAWEHRMSKGESYQAGPADDVYALGVTAYRLCTGLYPPEPEPEEGSEPQRRLLAPSDLATVSVGLERLVLACLAEDPRARPPAAALASALAAAAEEKDATRPINPTSSAAGTEETSHPGPRRRFAVPVWLSLGAAAAAGGLLVLALMQLSRPGVDSPTAPERPPEIAEHVHETPAPEAPDGGVGDGAVTSAVDVSRAGVPLYALALRMPREPLPGQRRPPCAEFFQKAINGGCWFGPSSTKKPPCGPEAFDYEDGCYMPAYTSPRAPTSEEPR